MANPQIVIELTGKDNATGKLVEGMKQVEHSVSGVKVSATGLTSSLGSLMSRMVALAGGTYAVYKITDAFKQGIEVVEDYKTSIIGIAAAIASMAKPGQGSLKEVYQRSKEYAQQMYQALIEEQGKHLSTLNEQMQVYNRLVQSGYVAQKSEVKGIAILADEIKMRTKGEAVSKQLNTEIMALMEGQARQGSLLAQDLRSRLGPDWAKIVEKHKEDNTLLQWLGTMYKGLNVASKDISNTITGQISKTKSLLTLISVGGLSGAYQDIVNWIKEGNEYLRTHQELTGKIAKAWDNVEKPIEVTLKNLGKISVELINITAKLDQIGRSPIWVGLAGAYAGFQLGGPVGAVLGGSFGAAAALQHQQQAQVKGIIDQAKNAGNTWADLEAMAKRGNKLQIPKAPPEFAFLNEPPEIERNRKPQDQVGQATSKLQSAQRQLENFINTMHQATAQAAGDSYAAAAAWLAKQEAWLAKQEAGLAKLETARAALQEAYQAKVQRLNQQFYQFINKESGNVYADLDAKSNKWLAVVGGDLGKIKAIWEIHDRDIALKDNQLTQNRINLEKEYLDQAAQLAPELEKQLDFKRTILDIDKQQGNLRLQQLLLSKQITPAVYEELKAYQAIINQAKEYQYQQEAAAKGGIAGGLWLWGAKQSKEGKTSTATAVADLMSELQTGTSQAVGNGLVNAMDGQKTNIEDIFKNAVASGVTKGFDYISGVLYTGLANLFKSALGGENFSGGGGFFSSLGKWLFGGGTPLVGYGTEGYSYGAAFQKFGRGDVLSRATIFPMAKGYGLMAEDGPEAAVPLIRTSGGYLGVRAVSSAPTIFKPKITIINNHPQAEISQKTTPEGDLVVTVDELMHQAYSLRGKFYKDLTQAKVRIR